MNDRIQRIEALLNQTLKPTHLEVIDQSHRHIGHPGARDGAGHFDVVITSPLFLGKSKLSCHRLVYSALDNMMHTEIHALTIKIVPA